MVGAICVLCILGTTPEHYLLMVDRLVLPNGPGVINAEEEFRPADLVYYQRFIESASAGQPQQVLAALHHLTSLSYVSTPVRAYLLSRQAVMELGTQQETGAINTLTALKQALKENSEACMYVDLAQAKSIAEGSGNFDEPFEPLTDAICRQYDLVFSKYDPSNRWVIEARLDFAAKLSQRAQLDHKHEVALSKQALSETKTAQNYLEQLSADNSVANDPIMQTHIETLRRTAKDQRAQTEGFLERVEAAREADSRQNRSILTGNLFLPPSGVALSTEKVSLVAAPTIRMPDPLPRSGHDTPARVLSLNGKQLVVLVLVATVLAAVLFIWRLKKRFE